MLGFYRRQSCAIYFCVILEIKSIGAGADPGFFLGGGALVSCSTSTPINHIVFLQNTSCIRKPQVISGVGGGGEHPLPPPPLPLDPPLWGMFFAYCRDVGDYHYALKHGTRNTTEPSNTEMSTKNEKNI